MPVSVQALRQGLLPSVTIQQAQHATMHIENHSEEILFDSTLTNKKGAAPLIDLLVLFERVLSVIMLIYKCYTKRIQIKTVESNVI